MSLEQAQAFAAKVAESPELQAREAELTGSNIDELAEQVAKIAAAEGFDCTAAEIKEAAKSHLGDLGEGELGDADLDAVAGGAGYPGKPGFEPPPGGYKPPPGGGGGGGGTYPGKPGFPPPGGGGGAPTPAPKPRPGGGGYPGKPY